MKREKIINGWQFIRIPNKVVKDNNYNFKRISEVKNSGYAVLSASVPGNFELDLMRENLLPDVYSDDNSLKTQDLENLHLYYFTEFDYSKSNGFDVFLTFEGIDTVAEIFVDGVKIGFVENMLIRHSFSLNGLNDGKHEVLVHIIPTVIYARNFDVPSSCRSSKYCWDSMVIRKAPCMFGWDIMPRIVSGGLWKPVKLEYLPKSRIMHPFTYTQKICKNKATVITNMKLNLFEDYTRNYSVVIKGQCGQSRFEKTVSLFSSSLRVEIELENSVLWWPKNYGEPNLYDIEIILLYNGVECDRVNYKTGIRVIELKRTSCYGKDGEFYFKVNGQKIYAMGTNWVPCDAFPSRHDDFLPRNLKMLEDLNCNMLRCWGGNVYPSEALYDFCDEHGIMIWQDFSLACAHYPDDDRLCSLMEKEALEVIYTYRNHASLIVWSGDNECDQLICCEDYIEPHTKETLKSPINPNYNKLTREIIFRALRNHDVSRPYLPSSPYIDDFAYFHGMPAENHLWNQMSFFKGEFYSASSCHFASEMGYLGCPSPNSIGKFISEKNLPDKIKDIATNPSWIIHSSIPETVTDDSPFAYRQGLIISQVERLFGVAYDDLNDFAKQSQISQAEALKYFIEHFRIQKWNKTGLLWWNLVDGWPQISDAVVDWYGCKKLAYSYIKRSQSPLCVMCDEPKDGKIDVCIANDTQSDKLVKYSIKNVVDGRIVAQNERLVKSNGLTVAETINEQKGAFYFIEWQSDNLTGVNHFASFIENKFDYATYIQNLKKVGFDKYFEGFDNN